MVTEGNHESCALLVELTSFACVGSNFLKLHFDKQFAVFGCSHLPALAVVPLAESEVASFAKLEVLEGRALPHTCTATEQEFEFSDVAGSAICLSIPGSGWKRSDNTPHDGTKFLGTLEALELRQSGSFIQAVAAFLH